MVKFPILGSYGRSGFRMATIRVVTFYVTMFVSEDDSTSNVTSYLAVAELLTSSFKIFESDMNVDMPISDNGSKKISSSLVSEERSFSSMSTSC